MTVHAQIKPHSRQRRQKLDYIIPMFENYNPSDDPVAIGDGILANGLNFNYDNSGAVQTARGYSKVNTTDLPAGTDNGWMFETSTLRQLVVATTAGYLYRYDNAGDWVQIGGPFTSGARWDGGMMRNELVLVNGYDGIITWDGTNLVTVTVNGYANIKPQYFCNRKNRAYFAERNSSLVWFTNPLDITTIQSNSFLQFNTDDGQFITGLGINVDNVTVLKDRTVWNIIGEPVTAGATTYVGNLQIRQSNSDEGCVSYKTITTVDNGLQVFVGTSGIYVHSNYRTTNIAPEMLNLFKYDMNPNFRHLTWAVYNPLEKKLMVGYASNAASTPDRVIMVDVSQSEIRFALWDDYNCSFGMQYKFTNTPVTVFGESNRGILWQGFQGYTHGAGDNGTSSGSNTATTINDTTKAWTTNQFKDSRVQITSGTGYSQWAYITANTTTTLTLDRSLSVVPDATSVYTIGAYQSFVDSKIFDFDDPALTKKYKFLNIFTDSENNYLLQVGVAYGKLPLSYTTTASLGGSTWTFEADNSANGWVWGSAALRFGNTTSLYDQINLGGNDRFVQVRFGTFQANQPWRITKFSFTYKEKKARPN